MEQGTIRIIVGILGIAFGFFHLYKRYQTTDVFTKLEAIKKQWGENNGSTFHLIAYIILPITLGLLLIAKGYFSF